MRKKVLTAIAAMMIVFIALCACAESAYRTLSPGDSGSDVLALKQRMYYLGYFTNLKNLSDKYNGTMVERVKQLQEMNGLEATGIASPELQALIYSDSCVYLPPTPVPTAVPTPAPTPIAPGDAPELPALDGEGFLAADDGEPYVYQNAEAGHWIYLSPKIQVEITRYQDTLIPLVWFETHMKLREGTPLRSLLSLNEGKTPGHAFKKPESILEDYGNVIVAFSDDFYGYRWKYNTAQGIIIRDGEIMSEKTLKNDNQSWPQLDVFAVFEDGSAKTFNSKDHTAEEYLAMGVRDTYAFGPILVQAGQVSSDVHAYPYARTRVAPRTAIGAIAPNEYLALTVTGRKKDSKGATILWLAEQMVSRGVQEALNLDGGNTCSLFFMGDLLNRSEFVQEKDVRSVTGLIGITEGD